jgi:hypothetical protein
MGGADVDGAGCRRVRGTNGDGVSGNPTISLANDLSAVEGLASNGIAVRTATDTWAVRTLTAGGGITITHGDGISANPTVAVDINGSASAVGGVASDDEVLIFDTSASAIRKATVATISGSGSTTVSDFGERHHAGRPD